MRRRLSIPLICMAAVGLLAAAVLVGGNTDPGRRLIERLTARLTGGAVQLSGLAGTFPGRPTLRELRLLDSRGVWLTATQVSLEWQPLALLEHQVRVLDLSVARLSIARAPAPGTSSGGPASIPHIVVARGVIDRLELGAPLAGAPAILTLRGSVDLRSLESATADLTAQRIDGDGVYALHARFDPRRVEGTLDVHEPAHGPLENLLSLPGLGALAVRAQLRGPVGDARFDLALDAGSLHGRAAGGLNLPRRSADVGFSLLAQAMAPNAALGWQRLAMHGRWRGPMTAPTVDGAIEGAELRLPGGLSLSALQASVVAAQGSLRVRAAVDGLQIPGPNPALLRGSPVNLDASIRLDDAAWPVSLTATHQLFNLRADAVPRGRQSLTFDLRLADLTPFAALLGADVRGGASFKGGVTGGANPRLTLDAAADLAGGKAAWLRLLGGHPTLQLTGTLTPTAIEVETLHVTGTSLSAWLQGTAGRTANSTVHARWNLAFDDLAALSPALAGRLRASGGCDGPLASFAVDAQLSAALSVRGSPSGTMSATVHATGLPRSPGGTLQANGELDGAPLRLDVELERSARAGAAGPLLHTVVHRADWKSAHADGDLTIGIGGGEARGQLHVQLDDLADLDRLLGVDFKGGVAATVGFKPVDGRAHADLRVTAHDVQAGALAGNGELTGDGPTDAIRLGLGVQLPALRGAPANLTASGMLNLDEQRMRLDAASLEYRGEHVHLLAPATLSFTDGMAFTELRLGAEQAVLGIQGRVAPTLDLQASLRGLGPAQMNLFLPAPLATGTLEADAELHGSFAAPTGRVRVDGLGLRASDEVADGLPALKVHAIAELRGDTAAVDARLDAGPASQLTVTGLVPLVGSGAFDVRVAGELDVGLVNPVLEAGGEHATGVISIDAAVSGTGAAPEIGGAIRLTKGSLRDYTLGVNLSKISGEIDGAAGLLQIKTLTATAASGPVSVTGTIGVLQAGLPLSLKVTAQHAEPLVGDIVTANVDATLTVIGKAREHLDVAGTVAVNRVTINIPDSLPPNVAVLDVRRLGAAAPSAPVRPLVIALDVAVHAPRQILVKGRGLDAELGGDLHLGGTIADPVVSGGFELQRGTFSLASSTLNFTAGRVSFDGAGLKNRIDPTLDFTADSTFTVPTVTTATLHIYGFADAPQFAFSSSPALPQDQILAGLLFGESASALSPLQIASIGDALATLSGGGGGLNPLTKLQKSLGLDRLSVGQATTTGPTGATTNTGASIEAGRYVTRRVFVEAKQTTQGTSQVQVNIDLTKHLKVQTRLGNGTATVQGTTPENDPGSSVGLIYQFEY